jgi:hypothetical protein
MDAEPEKGAGRRKAGTAHTINLKAVDPVTFRMVNVLAGYGRFGRSRPEVALYMIRSWLAENEQYFKEALAARDLLVSQGYPEPESEDE